MSYRKDWDTLEKIGQDLQEGKRRVCIAIIPGSRGLYHAVFPRMKVKLKESWYGLKNQEKYLPQMANDEHCTNQDTLQMLLQVMTENDGVTNGAVDIMPPQHP